jgi:biopolymer transport protein ExbB
MFELIDKGGQLMWLLLGCSIVALAVAVERLFFYHRATVHVGELLQGIGRLVADGRLDEALRESRAAPGPVARVLQSALMRPFLPRAELRDVVQEAGQLEVGRLETHVPVLSTIAVCAPLIGLLGTILGLVDAFVQVSEVHGYATPVQLSRGVYRSLVTTAGGLVVGVPAYILYTYVVARARHLMHDMERAGIEVVNLIMDARQAGILAGKEPGEGRAGE